MKVFLVLPGAFFWAWLFVNWVAMPILSAIAGWIWPKIEPIILDVLNKVLDKYDARQAKRRARL